VVNTLSRHWWIVALRGVAGIIFGILAFVWPGLTLLSLVILFGAFMLVDGVLALAAAVRFRHDTERWPMLLLEGVLGVVVGVLSLLFPGLAALAWLYTIAAWAVVTGILEIVFAIRLRKVIRGEVFVALTGILSIVFGILLAIMPLAGLVAWAWLIGAYAIATGILLIAFAFRLRKAGSSGIPSDFAPAGV
jgi:uncharacterized membrane protein HdeD (DUF308 family)